MITNIVNSIKLFLAGLFIRRATKIEGERDALRLQNKTQKEQLEIASRPPVSPSSVRDRMHYDEF